MRIAHATDIHWYEPATTSELLRSPKRLIGTANLIFRRRKNHFSRTVQAALVQHLTDLKPDLVCLTGDLTSTSLDSEFATARAALDPVLSTTPTFVIPGNHDRYTHGAHNSDRIRKHFDVWMGGTGPVTRLEIGSLTVLGLDPNQPTGLHAHGILPADQLIGLSHALNSPDLESRDVVLCVHYPLLDRQGALYDGWDHGLRNAAAVIEVLRKARKRPLAILSGHEHRGYRVDVDLGDVRVPLLNCGSSGYAYRPEVQRCAAMAVYDVTDGKLGAIERFHYDGNGFRPEEGGAFATGR